jgi:hypothetical protein
MALGIGQVRSPILTLPTSHQRVDFRPRLLDFDVPFEPADYIEIVPAAVAGIRRIELKRQPHLGGIVAAGRKNETRGHHPGHVGGLRVDLNLFTDDVGLFAEGAAP